VGQEGGARNASVGRRGTWSPCSGGGGGIGARCGEVKLRGFYEVGSDGKELHSMSV
jgi:hypothetical protein